MKTDILIVGGGLVGMIAAVALSSRYSVTILEKAPKPYDDNRTTALLTPSLDALTRWNIRKEKFGQPLQALRLINAHNNTNHDTIHFESPDGSPFGYNISNNDLKKQLTDQCTIIYGVIVEQILHRDDSINVILNNGEFLQARLLIVADGKFSRTRDLLGISAKIFETGQTALSFDVEHPQIPHNSISTEVYHKDVSATLVPIENPHHSAVVWMLPTRHLKSILHDVDTHITQATVGIQGDLTALSTPAHWPVASVLADKFYAHRSFIIGESAHAMPPIGAQGLNTSIRDIITLETLLQGATDPGAHEILSQYDQKRRRDTSARVAGTTLYNFATQASAIPPAIRSKVFQSLESYKFLQKPLIEIAQT
jgi:2-octaprenyl-6-methoxyphenol hydroxylase